MILLTTRLDPVRRNAFATSFPRAFRLEHANVASLAVCVTLVNDVGFSEGVFLALGE